MPILVAYFRLQGRPTLDSYITIACLTCKSKEEEHSRKYTGQEHSHKDSRKYKEHEHSRKYTVEEITVSIQYRKILERKLLGNTGNNN